jgi:hypothetical protein
MLRPPGSADAEREIFTANRDRIYLRTQIPPLAFPYSP